MDKLGERIFALRTSKNMSQGDLAAALDVSRQAVSKWENGAGTPTPENIVAMSVLFGVTTNHILMGKESFAEEEKAEEAPRAEEGFGKRKLAQIIGIMLISLTFAVALAAMFSFFELIIFSVYMAVCGAICLAAKGEYAAKILFFSVIYALAVWILMLMFNAF